MVGCCIWGRSWVGWRRGPGVRAALAAAGFGTKAGHQLQPQGSSKRSGPRRDQPCPGLLRPEDLSREELVDVLTAAVVDQKGPLVTVNKPQGLPVTGKPGDLTLLSVLPELSQSLGLGERELQIVRAPGNAITDGIPATSEGKIQAALKLEHIDGANLVVPVKPPSRKDILEGVKRTLSHFRVVATGSGCALVQLQPLTVFPSQLQVHMVLQLCPVLGDHMYSARVSTVLGQRFLLPAESTKPRKQVLDEALLRCLRLTPSQAAQLPLHLHLHSLLLPGPRPRDTPIELLAPLPPYFTKTLQCLGLRQQ
ncbi:mitochondrial mRNA pseudouridine synthase RPUSD3 isoform X3 [Elephas maximus indicus]|uniref:mitochondrial mRNA pseudouridine synthase RPUSD3 isoform X3 n=1 Tax=Elephas maximus indicus TaxID=99487 RepID=UPI002116279B|nr:mitochondrial mRNA pseudouridine synthase RPUSD3 isoform X3 [Elephas maximus indicus]